jgi:hypothetical protein
MFNRRIAVAAVAASALVFAAPTTANATPGTPPTPKVLTTKVIAPFNLAITKSSLYVADGGRNALVRVRADGSLKTIVYGPASAGGEVTGVAVSKRGDYIGYTTTVTSDEVNAHGALHVRAKNGATKTFSTIAYEEKANPDQVNQYGIVNAPDCAKAILGPDASYAGRVDSHAFSVAAYKNNSWLVADAAGNDIVKFDRKGHPSTVAVLPPQPLKITPDFIAAAGLPAEAADCLVGLTYNFEPVPTDIEVAPNGYLYVTTLAGGPEVGARGSVYRVNPRNGHSKLIATGLAGATNLALFKGKIYVAQLFAGQISVIKHGVAVPYVELPGTLSVEAGRGHLYAGTGVAGPSSVVKIVKGKATPIS